MGEPASLRMKVFEPIFLLGQERFQNLNIRVRVRGGGSLSQCLAVRQSIAKGIIAYTQKYDDESLKRQLKELLIQYDKSLLVAASPRSSVVTVPERVSRSPIDERLARATICRNQRHSLVSRLRRVYPSLICSLQNNFQMKNVCCK